MRVCKLVHWKEIAKDHMTQFCEVAKVVARSVEIHEPPSFADPGMKKFHRDEWRVLKWRMHFCGYEIWDDRGTTMYSRAGWCSAPHVEGKDIKFRFYSGAPNHTGEEVRVEFIPVAEFLAMKRRHEQEKIEEEYYAEQDFIPEVAEDEE